MGINEEIQNKMSKGITICRVPAKTYDYFMELSKDSCQDYGMTLKYLCDVHQGLIPIQGEALNAELQRLNDEIEQLKQLFNEKKEEQKGRMMMDGTIRK